METLAHDETGRLGASTAALLNLFEDELRRSVPALLSSTAEHAEVLGGVIAALAPARSTFVSEIIKGVNTSERRDKLRHRFLICRFQAHRPLPPATEIAKLLGEFESAESRDACLSELVEWLFFHESLTPPADWDQVLSRCFSILRAPTRHEALVRAYIIWRRVGNLNDDKLTIQLRDECRRSLRAVDSSWTQIDYGFTSAGALSKVDAEEAGEIYRDTIAIRQAANLPSPAAATAYIGCVKLAIRAFIGIVRRKLAVQDCLARLRELISRVPSSGERCRLYGELAQRCFSAGADEIGRAVAENDLLPALRSIPDEAFRSFALIEVAPALFRLHRQIAFDELQKVAPEARDEALSEICSFILTGLHSSDPNERSREKDFDIGYPAALDILECLDRMSKDWVLFSAISRLVSSVVRSGSPLTKEQRAEVARRLENVASRLPSVTGVSHEGFRVAVDAHIARLRNTSQNDWELIGARAEAIPNTCDRVLVLGLVAEALPPRYQDMRAGLLKKAIGLAPSIPWELDRISRLFSIASIATEVDSHIAKECLRDAFMLSKEIDRREAEDRQRAVVDAAYRIDPAFAKSLVALLDDDPARARAREELRKSIDVKDARREFGKEADVEGKLRQLTHRGVAELCWSLLGGLNVGRVATVNANATIPYVQIGGLRKLSEMYPVLAWMIENSVQRHDDTPYGARHLADLFSTAAFACDLAMRLISRASGLQQELSALSRPLTDSNEAVLIRAGEREKATAFLRTWLSANSPRYLKICDPYFTLDDLSLLMLVREAAPVCAVQLLTSEKKQKEAGVDEPYDDAYRKHWRLRISDQDPPDTDVIIVSLVGTGESPIHDRWIVGGGRGLRLGSSFSGLGGTKTSEISVLEPSMAVEREQEIDRYLTRHLREVAGRRIRYSVFSLL